MTLKTNISPALTRLFDTDWLGQDVTLNGTAYVAIVDFKQEWDEDEGAVVDVAEIEFLISDVAAWTEGDGGRDICIIGSDSWYLREGIRSDFVTIKGKFYRNERPGTIGAT